MLNRRKLLAIGGVVGGAVLLPEGASRPAVSASPAGHQHHHPTATGGVRSVGSRLAAEPFQVDMPLLPELQPIRSTRDTDLYRVNIQPTTAEILPGFNTPIFGYNGRFVGPTIRGRVGRKVKVTFQNNLDHPANVHLHGGHVAAVNDGHPMDIIDPGSSRLYEYPNTQQGATLWYHDHSHHTEAENVYRGLNGFYIIDDEREADLCLPRGGYDVPISLRDALFDENGTMLFGGNPAERNVALANGKPAPFFRVAARKYRFRLLNSGTERTWRLTLGNGEEMIQIASDGGLLSEPVTRTGIRLSSAERVEVVIDFAKYPIGTQLVLSDSVLGPVLRFDVVRRAADFSRVPSVLRPIPPLPAATNVRDVQLSFDFATGFPVGLVNGLPYDPNRSDFVIKRGTTEIWNVTNADPAAFGFLHTFHVHLVQFKILSRNGAAPGPDDIGRKDTFFMGAGDNVRLQATFPTDQLGKYAYHCHFLEHSSLGMMAQMEIVP